MKMENVKGYHQGSLISEGAQGKIFRGYYPKLDLSVCIKELKLPVSVQSCDSYDELSILKMLSHPNIIKYLDDYQFEGKQYIVMELIETGTLSSLIEEHQLKQEFIPEELILKYFSQLISVFKYCYDKQIIHRDAKSDNILYLKSNVLKLADFGLAKFVSGNKKEIESIEGSINGSVKYASPEVVQSDYYFFPTDVWSLGIIMYQLMSLELPFEKQVQLEL
jgi:NIMA (never in mitosis gene a)-related kinase